MLESPWSSVLFYPGDIFWSASPFEAKLGVLGISLQSLLDQNLKCNFPKTDWHKWHQCWISSSVGSKAVGSDSPSGMKYCSQGFLDTLGESLCGSNWTIPGLLLSKTCSELSSETKISTRKSSLQLRFWTQKRWTVWILTVENSTSRHPYVTQTNPKLTSNWLMMLPFTSDTFTPWTLSKF